MDISREISLKKKIQDKIRNWAFESKYSFFKNYKKIIIKKSYSYWLVYSNFHWFLFTFYITLVMFEGSSASQIKLHLTSNKKERERRMKEEEERMRLPNGENEWGRRDEEERDLDCYCRVWTPSSICRVHGPVFAESTSLLSRQLRLI